MRFKYGMLFALLLTGLAVFSVPFTSAAMSDPAAEEPSLEAPAPPSAEELPDKRTATTDTFELHSGMLETRIYGTPVNYEDAEGEWQPIEEGLEEGEGGEIVNGANSVEISLPSELQDGLARVTIGDQWVGSRLLATETEPAEVNEGAAVYESPEAKTSFEYTTLPDGLKEEIELEGPSSPSSFRYELTASSGLHAGMAEDGSVVFKDEEGNAVASLPAPTVADAQSVAPSADQVSYRLAPREGGAWILTVAVDPAWLEAPGRQFPVRIDPTIAREYSALDCTIGGKTGQEGWIDCGSWGREHLLAGYNAELNQAEDSWYRSLMYLQTAELIHGADVESASLELYSPEAASNTSGVQARKVTKPWSWRGNWKYYDSGKAWTAEGGDYSSEPLGEEKTSIRGSGKGWWSIPISASAVASAAGNEENLNLMVKLADDKARVCGATSCTHRLFSFDSSTGPAGYHPYLRVVYDFTKTSSAMHMTSPKEGTTSSHYLVLKSGWTSKSTQAYGVTYQVKLSQWSSFRRLPSKYVTDGNGEEVDWPQSIPANQYYETAPLYFDFKHWAGENGYAPFNEEDIKLRAVFASGTTVERGATEPVTVQYSGRSGGVGAPSDARAAVGPVSLDLSTGQYTISKTDVSIPVPGSEANLEFARTYESRWKTFSSYALGQGWEPSAPVEQEAAGLAWVSLAEKHQDAVPAEYETECWEEAGVKECETWMVEEAIPAADWIELTDSEGGTAAFEISGTSYVAPEYMKEWILEKAGENFTLTGPERVRTTFTPNSGGTAGEYRPSTVSWQATSKSARFVYTMPAGSTKYRLMKEIAPAGISCSDSESWKTAGCRTLEFNYFTCSCWGGYRLGSITYFGPDGSGVGTKVAEYAYTPEYRLAAEWDPRVSPEPLKETYSYSSNAELIGISPPGQQPWQLTYYQGGEFSVEEGANGGLPHYNWRDLDLIGRLKSVSRASLIESSPTATTTIAYQVPVSGSGAPYDMSPATVATWGQADLPLEAAAIFPPDQVPTSPRPTDFSHASVHYLDAEGYEVNAASPAPPGAEGPSISTSEVDVHGNVVRELTPQNRLRALAAGSSSAARSHELDTHSTYNADGTELLESWGPLHSVRLEGGETKEARARTVVSYEDPTPPAGQPPYYLPTKETTGAAVPGQEEMADQKVTEYRYDWSYRKLQKTLVVAADGSKIQVGASTWYGSDMGPTEISQPSNAEGTNPPGSLEINYYYAGFHNGPCNYVPQYAGLPCEIRPMGQTSGTGRPELLVKKFNAYNNLGEPTEIVESPGGGSTNVRKTLITYDAAGRQLTKKIEGGGQAIPKVETEYSSTLGLPVAERFKCESECGNPQFLTSLGYASQSHTGLKNPTDVAVDSSGNVWAVDKGNNRIVEYTEGGEFIRAAGSLGSGAGQLSSPSAITVDAYGNLDVADTGNNRVVRFNPEGKFQAAIGANVNKTKVEAGGTQAERNYCTASSGNVCQAGTSGTGEGLMAEPVGIASSSGMGGSVYVVERANNRVEKFGLQGELLAKFGSAGSAAGQFKEPSSIAIGPKHLWVADTGNNRIEKWSFSWTYEGQFGTEGSGNGQLKAPAAVESDAAGNVWVAEQGNSRVQKFSEAGEYLLKFSSFGTQEGQFVSPGGLAFDGKGNVLLADSTNNRVQKWSASGFDTQETKTTYDALGRPESYEDADGNVAKTTYDLDGRPVKTTDAKGSQTLRYDLTSGMPVELEDSAAGLFTASYNADGSLVKRTLPDGLTAETTYDPAGEPMHLTYTKASNCGASCTWLDFGLERSINGQIRKEAGTLGTEHYRYDKAGRLTYADETPTGGQCTTRAYIYDVDSNRYAKTTRSPGVGGVCAESGGTTQTYEYDGADRLMGPTYDAWGRITSLPAAFAGGKTLTTGYFSNDMVAVQSQGGVSNMFQLDATLRQRQRLQGGGLEGTEVFHYDGPSDSPAWTVRASTWTRNIGGLGGELAAVQESGKEITLQLTNLHGDVSATAAISPEVTSFKGTFSYDEFGNPISGSAGRYGWLGGKGPRTELPSGVIQMGARSYIPSLGRFLTADPVRGGSANPYDYANQDPVNHFDLNGECADQYARHGCRRGYGGKGKGNRATSPQYYRRKAHAIASAHHMAVPVVTSRKCTAIACTVGWPSGGSNNGFIEGVANSVINYLTHHNAATSTQETVQFVESMYGAARSPAGSIAVGCAQGATEAWRETAETREAYPDGAGFVPSVLYTVVKCAVGAAEN